MIFSAEEQKPRREPKYEIIVEKEEKLTVLEEVAGPSEASQPSENVKNPHKNLENSEKKSKNLKKLKTGNRKQRQRIGLLGAGTTYYVENNLLFYLVMFKMFVQISF